MKLGERNVKMGTGYAHHVLVVDSFHGDVKHVQYVGGPYTRSFPVDAPLYITRQAMPHYTL